MKPIATLTKWMDRATTAQQEELARRASTTRGYLYQLAKGTRRISAEVAGRIEEAAEAMAEEQTIPSFLPRDLLADTCATCPYALRCRGNK